MKTRFLTSKTRTALLIDLKEGGFVFKDEQGNDRLPQAFEQVSDGQGGTAIWLNHIPIAATYDEEGNELTAAYMSAEFHANVVNTDYKFATEMATTPNHPYNLFE